MKSQYCARRRSTALLFTSLVTLGLAACGGDSTSTGSSGGGGPPPPPPPIQVSATASQTLLFMGQTTQIVATVVNDRSSQGVQLTVSCPAADCGTLSWWDTASGVSTMYSTPTAVPPAPLTVTVTARSLASSSVTASVTITVSDTALTLSLNGTPVPAGSGGTPVPAGSSIPITATLVKDGANAQVNWSVSCPTAPCGALSPPTTASGVAATYTAPAAAPPADLGVTLTATSTGSPVLTTSVSVTVPAIEVAVSPARPPVMTAGTTQQFTATVRYDPAGKGVTWKLQCSAADCGTLASLASASSQAVAYQAPAAPPPTDLQVTVTAQSDSAPAAQGSTTITVKAVAVAITPISALVPLGVAQQFVANVGYDPSANGVGWQLLQTEAPCASACGTITPFTTLSGMPVTYTAPASLPANTTVTLKATSVTESSSSVTGTVIVTNGSVELAPVDLSFFKRRYMDGPAPQTATLTNTGHSPLTLSGIAISGTGASRFSQTNDCGTAVAPGASCTITVTFHWRPGTFAAVLAINDSSIDSPQKINLAGNAQASVPAMVHHALARQGGTLAAPRPTGDMTVGTRGLHLIDSTRSNPYAANGSRRELMVRFWYPTAGTDAATCARADYTAPQTWDYFGVLLGVTLPQVLTNSCRDATVAPGPHPVVLLSHGFTGTSSDYTYLAEDLASRGYVVAAIDHTNEATAVAFPDGRLEKSVLGSYLTDDWHSAPETLSLAVAVRLADLRFVLNQLNALNSAGGSFGGRLDLAHIALVGHSLGGLTTLRALESEPRIKAAVLLDALVPSRLTAPLRQPVLNVVVGRKWNETDCNLWGTLSGARLGVDLPAAEHLALSDAVWLLKGSIETGSTPETMIAATRDYVAAFLDASLGGKELRPALARLDTLRAGAVIAEGSQSLCTPP